MYICWRGACNERSVVGGIGAHRLNVLIVDLSRLVHPECYAIATNGAKIRVVL